MGETEVAATGTNVTIATIEGIVVTEVTVMIEETDTNEVMTEDSVSDLQRRLLRERKSVLQLRLQLERRSDPQHRLLLEGSGLKHLQRGMIATTAQTGVA